MWSHLRIKQRILEKRSSKKIFEEVTEGDKKSSSSFEFYDVSDVNFVIPSTRAV